MGRGRETIDGEKAEGKDEDKGDREIGMYTYETCRDLCITLSNDYARKMH